MSSPWTKLTEDEQKNIAATEAEYNGMAPLDRQALLNSLRTTVRSSLTAPKSIESLHLYFDKVLSFLDQIAGHCFDCRYSLAPRYGGHIVTEFLPYQERRVETQRVFSFMSIRNAKRKALGTQSADKEVNHLLAIPGSGGTGKSTFLVHFAESCYEPYGNPIVSILTFNKHMATTPASQSDAIGLRIIYGALRGMQCLHDMEWEDFYGHMSLFERETRITARDAVWLLRRLHGQERQVVILVDELSKSSQDEAVMRELGSVLDMDARSHVLVSALSPDYVESLMSNSKRPIDYAVLLPLQGGLCMAEAQKWVESLPLPNHFTSDQFKMNLLHSIPLLTSGHPRALQRLREALVEHPDVPFPVCRDMACFFTGSVITLLKKLARAVTYATQYGGEIDEASMQFLLDFKPISIHLSNPRSTKLRQLLERNGVYVDSIEAKFVKVATFLFTFFLSPLFGTPPSSAFPLVKAGYILFNNVTVVSQFYERSIDLSVMSHAHYQLTPEQMFAVQTLPGVRFQLPRIVCSQAKLDQDASVKQRFAAFGPLAADSVNIPPENNPGFDSAWRLSTIQTLEFEEENDFEHFNDREEKAKQTKREKKNNENDPMQSKKSDKEKKATKQLRKKKTKALKKLQKASESEDDDSEPTVEEENKTQKNKTKDANTAEREEKQGTSQDFVFYLQAKIGKSRKPLVSTVADAVSHVIEYHSIFHFEVPLAQVFIIFYIWDELQSVPKQEELMVRMSGLALQYVQEHYENIIVNDRRSVSEFLIPTLIQIPTLVNTLMGSSLSSADVVTTTQSLSTASSSVPITDVTATATTTAISAKGRS